MTEMMSKVMDLAIEADLHDDHVLSVALMNVLRTMKFPYATARNYTNAQSMVIELLEAGGDVRGDAGRATYPAAVRT